MVITAQSCSKSAINAILRVYKSGLDLPLQRLLILLYRPSRLLKKVLKC